MIKPTVVVCITSHNRVDCARINMEIIKLNFPKKWPVIHACSDTSYEQYIEDFLVKCEPQPLQMGALNLIKKSIEKANTEFSPDYFVHLEADTWVMNQEIIDRYIEILDKKPSAIIASSSWSYDKSIKWKNSKKKIKRLFYYLCTITKFFGWEWHIGWKKTIASQFFIAKNTKEFRELILNLPPPQTQDYLEHFLFHHFKKAFGSRAFVLMTEREPVHPEHREFCEEMELYCQHYPTSLEPPVNDSPETQVLSPYGKKEVLQKYSSFEKGFHMRKLLESSDLSYYNEKALRN